MPPKRRTGQPLKIILFINAAKISLEREGMPKKTKIDRKIKIYLS